MPVAPPAPARRPLLAPPTSGRLAAVDAARGAAMLLVCLSHFADAYFKPFGYGRTYEVLDRMVMVASPTFMMMSGAMLGLLGADAGRKWGSRAAKLIDRGVFLLTVAHLLIALAHLPFISPPRDVLRWGFITDAIGFASIVGPLCIGALRPAARVAVGGAVYALSWALVYLWQPAAPGVRLLKDALVGPSGDNSWAYNFPLLPWLGVYLASTALGDWLARRADAAQAGGISRVAALLGVGALALALALRGALRGFAGALVANPAGDWLRELTSIAHKIPPGPLYLLFYGGAGLLLVSACFAAVGGQRGERWLGWLQLLGRNSLFTFVFQYYLYFVAMYLLRLRYTPFWPLYFLASLGLLLPTVKGWEAAGGNRLITVGLRRRRDRPGD